MRNAVLRGVLGVVICAGAMAVARADVTDPQGILAATDEFLGGVPFAQAFVPGDQFTFTFRSCSFLDCPAESSLTPTRARVVDEDGVIKINQYKPTGEVFSSEPISSADWDGVNRSYLRAKIASVGSFGLQVTILSMAEAACPAVAGSADAGTCRLVKFRGVNAAGFASDFEYLIRRSARGVGQVVGYVQSDTAPIKSRTEYKLRSVGF